MQKVRERDRACPKTIVTRTPQSILPKTRKVSVQEMTTQTKDEHNHSSTRTNINENNNDDEGGALLITAIHINL